MDTLLTPLKTPTPHELKHFGNHDGEITLIQNPDVFPSRYEVWMTRVEWEDWRRLVATDDFTEAEAAFLQGLTQL